MKAADSHSEHPESGQSRLKDHVKDLGRKARARLQEERSKRPEIVRLEGELPPPPIAETAPTADKSGSLRRTTTFRSTPVLPKRKRRRVSAARNTVVQDKDVDRWMPSISQLPACTKESRSRLVQLHGLPFGTTVSDIRRFFSGLSPQRILLLPSYRKGYFLELDASDSYPRKTGGVHVDRYEADLRILVQFESAPTASLAADRSGEVMPLTHERTSAQGTATEERTEYATGAAVAVSQILKPISSHFMKHMVVDAEHGIPLHQTLEQIEKNLNPLINEILWESAKRVLLLRSTDHKLKPGTSVFALSKAMLVSGKPAEYRRLIEQRNSLLHHLEEVRYQLPFPSAELLDPALADDPILRLTTGAAECLETEVKRLDDQLLRARRLNSGLGRCLENAASFESK